MLVGVGTTLGDALSALPGTVARGRETGTVMAVLGG